MPSMVSLFYWVEIGVVLTGIGSTLVRLAYNDNVLPSYVNSTLYDTGCASLTSAILGS